MTGERRVRAEKIAMSPISTALLVAVGLACLAGLTSGLPAGQGQYTTKYDNINLEEVLTNQRLYKKYLDCLLGKGKCSPEGKELKDRLPEALATNCAKCSPRQKNGSERVLRFLIEKKPQDWAQLEKLYDPSGNYRKRYQAEAAKRGIKI